MLRLTKKQAGACGIFRVVVRRGDKYKSTFKRVASETLVQLYEGSSPVLMNNSMRSWLTCDNPGCNKLCYQMCGGCSGVWYCDRACQKAHWSSGHRHGCKCRGLPPLTVVQPAKNV
jgi:hypothetical protein